MIFVFIELILTQHSSHCYVKYVHIQYIHTFTCLYTHVHIYKHTHIIAIMYC